MEMNTRLQVEHPVTEEITGVDLVEWQLRVASGEPLPCKQEELEINGWAVEARLYAEDPATGFLPSVGKLEIFDLLLDYRVDTGVEEGSTVSPFYDPMIAKMIVSADTRERALSELAGQLQYSTVWPVKTNKAFLYRLLNDPDVMAGMVDTGLIARRGDELLADPAPSNHDLTHAAKWLLRNLTGFQRIPNGLFGFRLNRAPLNRLAVGINGKRIEFDYEWGGPFHSGFRELPDAVLMEKDGAHLRIAVPRIDGNAAAAAGDGAILAPMPGRITVIDTKAGDLVVKGEMLVTLEAMKMEHALRAPFDGTVMFMDLQVGQQVSEGQLLVQVEKAE